MKTANNKDMMIIMIGLQNVKWCRALN